MRKVWHEVVKMLQLLVVQGLGMLICAPVFLLFFGSLAVGIYTTMIQFN